MKEQRIAELKAQIAALQQELQYWESGISSFTDLEAYEKCKNIPNDFAQSLASRPLAILSPKQIMWLHILANRNYPPKEVEINTNTVKLRYTFEQIADLALSKGYFLKRIVKGNYRYTLASDASFSESIDFRNLTEVKDFLN